MHIILVANYVPDGQESMDRFANMLKSGFEQEQHSVEIIRPAVLAGKIAKTTSSGIGKWLGYVDKWLIFPLALRLRKPRQKETWYHVCDHSNAPYLQHLPKKRSSITCHDVLAIRGALGYADAYCEASGFGKILQSWILSNLGKARCLAADSELTMRQLKELATQEDASRWIVIPIAFNDHFEPVPISRREPLLNQVGLTGEDSYILHVGSGLPRKNRGLLLQMAAVLGDRWTGKICYAGAAMDDNLKKEADRLGLSHRVTEVTGPDHETLLALYSACEAFVFPSYSEGFGWPVIEAQACGAPVIASSREPMTEVSGGAALHADPDDAPAYSEAFLRLNEPKFRKSLIESGHKNCERYTPGEMTRAYLELIGAQ